MRIGFTGTRHGMTSRQAYVFRDLLCCKLSDVTEFHHGDCVGSDDQAANIVYELNYSGDPPNQPIRIIVHPPVDQSHRANNVCGNEVLPPRSYLMRNLDIVDNADLLIATPAEAEEQPRGETWRTVRYAKNQGKPVWIICPDGTVRKE